MKLPWTKAETDVLFEHFYDSEWDIILSLLPDRRKDGIYKKAALLGLSRTPKKFQSKDGDIRIRKHVDGNLKFIRIAKGMWIPLSRYVWEKSNGEIPDRHMVCYKDGDTLNCELDNLFLASAAQLLKLNNTKGLAKRGKSKAPVYSFPKQGSGNYDRTPRPETVLVKTNKAESSSGKVRITVGKITVWAHPNYIEETRQRLTW